MRLIDADALKEAIQEHTDYKGYLVCDPEEIIDLAPTVEPKQGEWIAENNGYEETDYKCPFCGHYELHSTYNFCPNCGADLS